MDTTIKSLVGGALLGAMVGTQGCGTPQNHSGTDTASAETSARAEIGGSVTARATGMEAGKDTAFGADKDSVSDEFAAIHSALNRIQGRNPNKYPVIGEAPDTTIVVPFSVISGDIRVTADDYAKFILGHVGSMKDVETVTMDGAVIKYKDTREIGPLELSDAIRRGFGDCEDFTHLASEALKKIDPALGAREISFNLKGKNAGAHTVCVYLKNGVLRVVDQGLDETYESFKNRMKKYGGIKNQAETHRTEKGSTMVSLDENLRTTDGGLVFYVPDADLAAYPTAKELVAGMYLPQDWFKTYGVRTVFCLSDDTVTSNGFTYPHQTGCEVTVYFEDTNKNGRPELVKKTAKR